MYKIGTNNHTNHATNYSNQQTILHKQVRTERFFWTCFASIACAIVLCILSGCGGNDITKEDAEDMTEGLSTPCTNTEMDKDFVGPCDLNPPVVIMPNPEAGL